ATRRATHEGPPRWSFVLRFAAARGAAEPPPARVSGPRPGGQAPRSPVRPHRPDLHQRGTPNLICPRGGMRHRPTFEEFAALAEGVTVVPVYRQLIGDTLTPVSAFCKIQEGDWAFLFESVVGGERVGRYSFVGAGPFLTFQAFGHRVVTQSQA